MPSSPDSARSTSPKRTTGARGPSSASAAGYGAWRGKAPGGAANEPSPARRARESVVRERLHRMLGADLTAIPTVGVETALPESRVPGTAGTPRLHRRRETRRGRAGPLRAALTAREPPAVPSLSQRGNRPENDRDSRPATQQSAPRTLVSTVRSPRPHGTPHPDTPEASSAYNSAAGRPRSAPAVRPVRSECWQSRGSRPAPAHAGRPAGRNGGRGGADSERRGVSETTRTPCVGRRGRGGRAGPEKARGNTGLYQFSGRWDRTQTAPIDAR